MRNINYNSKEYLEKVNKYWSACNYLSVAQLYLLVQDKHTPESHLLIFQ